MTDVVTTWLMLTLALSLAALICYISRDMARERRMEREWE